MARERDSDVPQPGPARLTKGAGPDEWLEQAKQCKYLPESDMKRLCEIVKECLMEGELLQHCGKQRPSGPASYTISWNRCAAQELLPYAG